MINPDLPIRSVEEDSLNRSGFAIHLANAVVNHDRPEGFVIGLHGKWGSGKTSVLNMMSEQIELMHQDESEKPIVLRFNPWLCPDPEQLVFQFFTQLSSIIKKTSKLDRLIDAIDRYSDALRVIPTTPVVYTATSFVLGIVRGFNKRTRVEEDIQKFKDELTEILRKDRVKIIVMIDDLDRLSNEEIVSVFQLVKAIADFPYSVYILAFDREIVVEALNMVQKSDGSEYLEKIVQVPFQLPDPEPDDIYRIFIDRLKPNIDENAEKKWNDLHWNRVYFGIEPYLHSVRDVSRLLNAFVLKYTLLKEEVNMIDLLGVTCIQIFEPVLYDMLPLHSSTLCGGVYQNNFDFHQEDMKNTQVSYDILLAGVSDEGKRDMAGNILSALFPKLNHISKGISMMFRNYDDLEALNNTSISHPDCFNRYFKLNLESSAIPSAVVNYLLLESSEIELSEGLERIKSSGKIRTLLNHVNAKFGGKDKNPGLSRRAALIMKNLLISESCSKGYVSPFYQPFDVHLTYSLNTLLKNMSESDRYDVLYEAFEYSNVDLGKVADLLRTLRDQHKHSSNDSEKYGIDSQLLTLDKIQKLEGAFVKYVTSIGTDKLLSLNSATYILWLLNKIDNKIHDKYTQDLIANDLTLAHLIIASIGHGTVLDFEQSRTWNLDAASLERYIDPNIAYHRMINFVKTEDFKGMPLDKKQNLAAFLIHMEGWKIGNGLTIMGRIRIEDIDKKLDEINN